MLRRIGMYFLTIDVVLLIPWMTLAVRTYDSLVVRESLDFWTICQVNLEISFAKTGRENLIISKHFYLFHIKLTEINQSKFLVEKNLLIIKEKSK